MAQKSNIRSMRFSDTMIEMIESQTGDTFTAKFEALVTRCMWELPKKEQELQTIQRLIDKEKDRLKKISEKNTELERTMNSMIGIADYARKQLHTNIKKMQEIIDEK